VRYGISDEQAWGVGLACGATVDVLMEPLVHPEVEEAARARGRVVVTPLPPSDGAPPDAVLVVRDGDAVPGHLESAIADAFAIGRSSVVEQEGIAWFVEAFARPPRLVVVGAVQVAVPLASMARALGYEVAIVDARPAFATRERFPEVECLVVAWPDEAADVLALGASDAVAVLTHDPKFDEPAIATALARGCRYVGAIGSRRTQAQRRERLLAAGVPEDDLRRLRGPIGLDLGGREPAETALAILAEIVAERHGASGAPLSVG
jgi:xanthine dehydrogenase accessory factor